MLMISLQSGSCGNCIYVESGDVRLFFDAGISALQATQRLAAYGKTPNCDALFISHDHADHIRCAGVFSRKFNLPVYVTERTLAVTHKRFSLGKIDHVQHFRAGQSIKIRHVTVETIPTPHDAVDGSVFVVDDGKHRLGICTDLGHVFSDMTSLVKSVDGLFLESNYDEEMLRKGDYPPALKRRISGDGGHISNIEAAELVAKHKTDRLKWLCLAHLSEENNSPALALATNRKIIGASLPIYLGSRYQATETIFLGAQNEKRSEKALPLERFFL